jgi:4-alpha-glucanotransferase
LLTKDNIIKKRASGILLHITSLPNKAGSNGDLGRQAYRFADFLYEAGQSYWQILPLNPPCSLSDPSPYNCLSAFAGNIKLIAPEFLPKSSEIIKTRKFADFCNDNKYWLDDYCLFVTLKNFYSAQWQNWPKPLRTRLPGALKKAHQEFESDIQRQKILQFLFFEQWFALKKYCNDLGIRIIGDMPIYVADKSADVWANQEIFKLDREGRPIFISGVPPDAFSRTGQLWGNPIYNWKAISQTRYRWWIERIKLNLKLYDVLRIDHFRGLVKFWQVRAVEKTAVNGKWVKGPGQELFKALYKELPKAEFIAEDLGYITADVRELVQKLGLPGMKVLLFAFDDLSGKNPYLPHNHTQNFVVYTGTHDNNTIKGWFEKEARSKQKHALFAYLGQKVEAEKLSWELIRMAMNSVANTAIIPMQDILGLGSQARMNYPSKTKGNWRWQLENGQISTILAKRLRKITQLYNRLP